ncbi:ATP-binding cassette domain-containing protein [Halarcobacter anaerophilus]|uniref:Iron ABC transporter ATP-binding protein n=1 Tax=Halarcobacter anaerophilus TaxID=877500 RepID=A0A4Q0Y7B7_9BACT|nr:ATP-binding cassette domain-containing protein [Halarcobacter anaerophilus]QDF29134.1 iron siderophore ABC transporter, ATP-binding protein [Halarcobacter anaerophilus]RXJ64391.1 iron ABC transporter ATP-binding protein [Halarcobacter anaerophilus]
MLKISNYSNLILKDISFILKENENLIILGSNGAGKSTLAKVLSNLIENQSVELFDKNISTLEDKKRVELINYVPPRFEIFDEYITVYEFLELSFIKSIKKEKINEVLKLLGIESIKNRVCVDLSSGEKQLLLLASSLIHNAKITIFDELTANMDISRVKEVYTLFKMDYLKQKIIITHNLDLAFHLKYKVLYLQNGVIKFFGGCEEFFLEENLSRFYKNSLKVVDNHLVVNL